MLRATVYTIIDGVPTRREVVALPVTTPAEFTAALKEKLRGVVNVATYELGPIGEPWPTWVTGPRQTVK